MKSNPEKLDVSGPYLLVEISPASESDEDGFEVDEVTAVNLHEHKLELEPSGARLNDIDWFKEAVNDEGLETLLWGDPRPADRPWVLLGRMRFSGASAPYFDDAEQWFEVIREAPFHCAHKPIPYEHRNHLEPT